MGASDKTTNRHLRICVNAGLLAPPPNGDAPACAACPNGDAPEAAAPKPPAAACPNGDAPEPAAACPNGEPPAAACPNGEPPAAACPNGDAPPLPDWPKPGEAAWPKADAVAARVYFVTPYTRAG